MALIEKRYGEALLDISFDLNQIEAFQKDLTLLSNNFTQEPSLREFLLNPSRTMESKNTLIRNIYQDTISKEVLNFVLLLLERRNVKLLPAIAKEYMLMSDKKQNVVQLKIDAAASLDDDQLKRLKENYSKRFDAADVKYQVNTDPALVGGIRVQTGDMLLEDSIKKRMDDLKKILMG
ncbi:MAG: ATP synthase F1 subunit delta [Eubacteriaceae bacterium]|nr:ATP synthase F1 subunit delta [Eubacteriaceae bacterium]